MKNSFFVYMLEMANGCYYTGYTTDLKRRFREHLEGKSKYTRAFHAVRVARSWKVQESRSTAMKIECYIKSRCRKTKDTFVARPKKLKDNLEKSWDRKVKIRTYYLKSQEGKKAQRKSLHK